MPAWNRLICSIYRGRSENGTLNESQPAHYHAQQSCTKIFVRLEFFYFFSIFINTLNLFLNYYKRKKVKSFNFDVHNSAYINNQTHMICCFAGMRIDLRRHDNAPLHMYKIHFGIHIFMCCELRAYQPHAFMYIKSHRDIGKRVLARQAGARSRSSS